MSTTHGNAEPELRFSFSDRRLIAVLATLATALFAFATRLRLNEKPWGDEPHYLIMSIALSTLGAACWHGISRYGRILPSAISGITASTWG